MKLKDVKRCHHKAEENDELQNLQKKKKRLKKTKKKLMEKIWHVSDLIIQVRGGFILMHV